MHLFSSRSQMMSKCGKNKEGAHESVSVMFLPHFAQDRCPLWSITEQTHCYMKSICFIQWRENKKQQTHTCLVPLDCSRICASSLSDLCTVSLKSFSMPSLAQSNYYENIFQNCESHIAMTHIGNFCDDFLQFTHPKNSRTLFVSFLYFSSLQFISSC